MSEEGKITMNEFKMVVERFEENQKKIVEVVNYRFDKLESRQDKTEAKTDSMMEQIALLHEGQTEIKAELRSGLKDRVTYSDFAKLEKRVVRLENKVA